MFFRSCIFNLSHRVIHQQQIVDWFKRRRRGVTASSKPQPKAVLDLSGNGIRKPAPKQFYHAYSVIYFRPEDSPLRKEVEGLWKRRSQKEVIDKLTPFASQGDDLSNRLFFHNAVMRWKCSLLNEDERRKVEEWIENDVQERWDEAKHPWKALQTQDVDQMTAENQYVQEYIRPLTSTFNVSNRGHFRAIDALPTTMQAALDEVERVTGMKAILLMSGPVPAQDGDIGTHL